MIISIAWKGRRSKDISARERKERGGRLFLRAAKRKGGETRRKRAFRRGIEAAMRVRTQYILIDVFPGGRWITTVSGIFIYIVAISRALVEPPEVRRIIRSSADVQRREGYESSLDAQLSTSIFIFRLINPESRHVPPGAVPRTRPPFFLRVGRPRLPWETAKRSLLVAG